METYVTDERTGLKYELVGDYYLIVGEDEPEGTHPVGIWGQRHKRYLKEHKQAVYTALLLSGRLNSYLADIDQQAQEQLGTLVEQMKQAQGITERLKADNPMAWVGRMNNIRACAMEIVNKEIIYA
jgi:hypothetical protein